MNNLQFPIAGVRLLSATFAIFAINTLCYRFFNQYEWTNCLKTWIDTGGFRNCVVHSAPPNFSASLAFGIFMAIAFLVLFGRRKT